MGPLGLLGLLGSAWEASRKQTNEFKPRCHLEDKFMTVGRTSGHAGQLTRHSLAVNDGCQVFPKTLEKHCHSQLNGRGYTCFSNA